MSAPVTARSPLRELTRAEHEAVDRLYSRFDLTRAGGYRSFLAAQASAHLGIEALLDAAGAAGLVEGWAERRRGDLLRADLTELGIVAPRPVAPPPLLADAELLGAVYVLEGSRLGGALLARRVAAGMPVRFLSAPARPGAWRDLLVLLARRLDSDAALHAAAGAARACFRCFERGAAMEMEPLVA